MTTEIVSQKLPPEFKAKWLAALRSGEYKQTKGSLYSNEALYGGHCCLGVAGHVCGIPTEKMIASGVFCSDDMVYLAKKHQLPELLIGKGVLGSVVGQLTKMNDGGNSFLEIADWIEVNL